jgi:hypothetical protein
MSEERKKFPSFGAPLQTGFFVPQNTEKNRKCSDARNKKCRVEDTK